MLDFAHEDRIAPRRAPQNTGSCAGRFALTDSDLRLASREAWVLAIKRQVEAGEYPLDEKLDRALEIMLAETT